MNTEPLVSVVILTYNQERFIQEALDSVLAQNYKNLQIVISDDGSTDNTKKILLEYAKKNNRITLILNRKNGGITKNTNAALRYCKGEFVAFMGGDDVFLSGKISRQVNYMLSHPNIPLSYHDLDVFHSSTEKTLYCWSERYGKRTGDVHSVIAYGPYMGALSVMARRSFFPPEGLDKRIRIVSDWYLWVYILAKSGQKIGYLDAILARYRRHLDNVTSNWPAKIDDQYRAIQVMEEKWPKYRKYAKRRRAELKFIEGILLLKNKKIIKSFSTLTQSSFSSWPYIFPWLRLVFRELWFLRHGKDDLVQSLVAAKNKKT